MCDIRGKGKWRLCTWMIVNLFSFSKNEIWRMGYEVVRDCSQDSR